MKLINNPKNTFADHTGKKLSTEDLLEKITGLAVCVTDKNGNFIEVNEAYINLYGYTEPELIGNHFL